MIHCPTKPKKALWVILNDNRLLSKSESQNYNSIISLITFLNIILKLIRNLQEIFRKKRILSPHIIWDYNFLKTRKFYNFWNLIRFMNKNRKWKLEKGELEATFMKRSVDKK